MQAMQYKVGDMVFAKCQNYPYWPGKIISCQPNLLSYKVLFYGEKSQATIDESVILPYNEDVQRKILNEGNNKNNKNLRNSMNIAFKRYQQRKKGMASESEEEDYLQQSEIKQNDLSDRQKIKKFMLVKQPEEIHLVLGNLLNLLSQEAATFSHTKDKVVKFTPDHEARLRKILDPSSQLSIGSLIDFKIIQKFILVLKELDLWGLNGFGDLHQIIRNRYEFFKSIILSESFASIPLREARREIIIQKVLQNKAVL